MSAQHTHGQWFVGAGTGCLNQVAIEPAIGCAYGAGDEVKANARLIAAAPDLLAALEEARDGLRWYQDRNPGQTDSSDDEAMARIAAAIARATGEAP